MKGISRPPTNIPIECWHGRNAAVFIALGTSPHNKCFLVQYTIYSESLGMLQITEYVAKKKIIIGETCDNDFVPAMVGFMVY